MCDQGWCNHPDDMVRCQYHGRYNSNHIHWLTTGEYEGWWCANTPDGHGHKITQGQYDKSVKHWADEKERLEKEHLAHAAGSVEDF
jgi:hypothetical protein